MRLGLHVNNHGHEADILRYVREVRPPCVKFLADALNPDLMNECRALGAKVILRPVADSLESGAPGWRVLRDQVLKVGREYAGCFDYLEGANEELQGKDDPEEIDRLAELLMDFAKACQDAGFNAALGGLSVGQPEVERWSRPAVAAMLDLAGRTGAIITLHEYYHSRPWDLLEGGREAWGRYGQAEGWLMLRCVKAVKVWRSLGIHVPRFVISESGRDDVTAAPGFGKGWRDEPTTPDGDFADFMAGYCRHLATIPECLGVMDFGFSTIQPEKWGSFDLAGTGMFERMIVEMKRLPLVTQGGQTMIAGLDVSRYQGRMDWSRAAAAGARFTWCKATEGTDWVDPRFHDNAAGAKTAGLLVGAYHYFRNTVDPVAQARHFADACARHELTLPPALDFEDTSAPAHPAAMRTFCEEVGRLLGRPVIYTAAWWWTRSRLGGAQPWASAYPLWVADYEGAVALPGDWSDWTIHQYTSSGHGPSLGAEQPRIDRNRYRGTVQQLAALRQGPAATLSEVELVAAAEAEHKERGVRLFPGAGIQRAILADGYVPTTNERDYRDASGQYVYQRAERLAGGEPRVYVWDPRAGTVRWIPIRTQQAA